MCYNMTMKEYEREKRDEIIWAIAEQGYSQQSIARMFNLSKARVSVVVSERPADWKSPWVKLKVKCVCQK